MDRPKKWHIEVGASPKKKIKHLKTEIIKDIKNLFEQEADFYKPVRLGNFYTKNYIEYEKNGDWNKTLSIK